MQQLISLAIENKYSSYNDALIYLYAENLDAVSAYDKNSFSSINIELLENNGNPQRIFDFELSRKWDIVTNFRCELFVDKSWHLLDTEKLSLLSDADEILDKVTPDDNILCAMYNELKIRVHFGQVVPLFFRVMYTGILVNSDVLKFWISKNLQKFPVTKVIL
jgi:hypothetical protein